MPDKLQQYNDKRNFDITDEPVGKTEKTKSALSFAVQHHMASHDHFDFRLEWNGALLSWAVPKGPSFDIRDKRLAMMVEDHPVDYRDFEGTIPKGQYGGGTVMLWDEGEWEPESPDVDESLAKGSLKFVLNGKRLKGKWVLLHIKGAQDKRGNSWLLIKENDAFAKTDAGISEFKTSVKTGRTMEEIGQQA